MIDTFLFRFTLMAALVMTGHLVLAQSQFADSNTQYTATKRLLSIEDGLASHVFCGV